MRIAELTAGSEAILFACRKAVDEQKPALLGLPMNCQPRMLGDKVCLHSLTAAEHDIRGYAVGVDRLLGKVKLSETLNPCVRSFRALKMKPVV